MPLISVSAAPFLDVPQNAWFHEAVAWAFENDITTGTTQTTFSPNAIVTRGEFVTFLHRIAERPNNGLTATFPDVANPTSFHFEAVNWAAATGIVTGFGDGTFRPNSPITREELATMMFRFARARGSDITAPATALHRFPDQSNVSPFAVEGMQWATNRGIVRGNGGRLLPRATATRAESLTMLHRYAMDLPFTPPPATGIMHHTMFNGVMIGGPATPTANDQYVWDFLISRGLNSFAAAGIMGNLFAESGMRPDAVERAHWQRLQNPRPGSVAIAPMSDAAYVAVVNDGTYRHIHPLHPGNNILGINPEESARNSFALDRVGFGLSQWTWPPRKMNMYTRTRNFHDELGVEFNIGCLYAQLEFFWHELTTDSFYRTRVFLPLQNTTCVLEASNLVLFFFMNPAAVHQEPPAQGRRAGFSLSYFNRFGI